MNENPLKMRRLAAGRTQDQLANEAGVTHDNVVRNEQGLFNNPSPKVLWTLVRISGDSIEQIIKEYTAWIAAKRREEPLRSIVKRHISFQRPEVLTEHPFLLWRRAVTPGISRIAFCQMLCIHPATLLKYEKGDQRPMPSQIYLALKEAGMEISRINELAELGSKYFVYRSAKHQSA